MVLNLFDGERMHENWRIVSSISAVIICQNILVIVAVIALFLGLIKVAPFLNWSWFSLFSREGMNIHLIPSNVKYFGLAFLVLFGINLPRYAQMEEVWFREGTISWEQGLLMSILFGMVHCLVGVPIGAGLAISLAGLWFTHQYFVGGVELSTVHHTSYNLILVTILFLTLMFKHISDLRREKT